LLRDQLTNVPPTGAPVSGRTRRFEWLRLVSAMLVVLCHFAALYAAVFHSFDVDSATFSAAPSTITTALTALYFQFHGAYVFFAISGFVITRPWFATARTPAAIAFLGRRAFRLLPAATVAIIAVAYFDFYHLDFRQVDFATLLQNLLYVNWLPPYTVPPVLIVTWTLAVEWLFYFAAPFVVSAIVRLQHPILAVVTLAILLNCDRTPA
jgi:peptidoglycan/LPS O-acetylase OafA/YrhL